MAFKNGSILRLGFFFEGIFETRERREKKLFSPAPFVHEQSTSLMDEWKLGSKVSRIFCIRSNLIFTDLAAAHARIRDFGRLLSPFPSKRKPYRKAWKLLSRPILAIVNRNEINDHGTLGFSSSFPSITPRGPIPSQPIKSIT